MSTRLDTIHSPDLGETDARSTWLDRFARRLVLARLERLTNGQIIVTEQENHRAFGQLGADFPVSVQLRVLSPKFYTEIAFGGSIGACEAYMQGYWACDDLGELLRMFLRNRQVLDDMDSGPARITRPVQKLFHALHRNTRAGSRKNISAHYDLGNDFYALWLDSKMMYSSAFFENDNDSLEDAATTKLDMICRKLDLSAGDRVIEIGSGWGGFAMYAATHYGCHVTTTTISQQQYDYARKAIDEAGLADRITLLLKDYRDLEGSYDKLVSIEMVEAVGYEYHDTFFRKCCDLLKPDGKMLLQAITIADQRYEKYKKSVDFIKRYIFPGGCLTSVTDMTRVMTSETDMRVIDLEDIGPHYATTLRHWHDRFLARIDEIRALGYTDAFLRLWKFYLVSCESAFTERAIGDVQLLIMRPEAR